MAMNRAPSNPRLPRLVCGLSLLGLLAGCVADPSPTRPELRRIEAPSPHDITALVVDSAGKLWCAARGPDLNQTRIWRRDESGWSDSSAGLLEHADISSLWAHPSGALLASGVGRVWRWRGDAWQPLVESGDTEPIVMAASDDGALVLACVYYPWLERRSLDGPEAIDTGPVAFGPAGVWAFDREHVVALPAFGDQSAWRFRGGAWGDSEAWRALPFPDGVDPSTLRAAWSPDGAQLLAVGAQGQILRLIGDAWQLEPAPTRHDLLAVWGNRADRCLAVGKQGTVLWFQQTHWSVLAVDQPQAFMAVCGDRWGRAFIGGEAGVLFEVIWPEP